MRKTLLCRACSKSVVVQQLRVKSNERLRCECGGVMDVDANEVTMRKLKSQEKKKEAKKKRAQGKKPKWLVKQREPMVQAKANPEPDAKEKWLDYIKRGSMVQVPGAAE